MEKAAFLYYLAMKALLLITLTRSFVVNQAFQRHWIFFSLLYTAGVAAASWVFVLSMHRGIPNEEWQHWLVKTFLAAAVYFKLLSRFDEGFLFWVIFSIGLLGLLWF